MEPESFPSTNPLQLFVFVVCHSYNLFYNPFPIIATVPQPQKYALKYLSTPMSACLPKNVAPNSPRDIALPSSPQQGKCIEHVHETRCDSVIFAYVRTEYTIKTAPEAPQAIFNGGKFVHV